MQFVFNAGSGDKAYGWCYFFCKGTSKQINRGEKELWDDRVKDFWQKKTWIDSVVMIDLARHFLRIKLLFMVKMCG